MELSTTQPHPRGISLLQGDPVNKSPKPRVIRDSAGRPWVVRGAVARARKGGSLKEGYQPYVRMVSLAEEIVCKGKKTPPAAWEASRGSLCLEQSTDFNAGRAGSMQ